MGPLPKPTAIKIAEGNPGHKKLPKEPKAPAAKSLEAPEFLSPEAKILWDKLAPVYQDAGLLAEFDLFRFGHYLSAIAHSNRLMKEIDEHGATVQVINKKGHASDQHHPRHNQYLDMIRLADKLGAHFGDSPAARARLGRLMDNDEDELTSLLGEKPA